VDEGEGPHEDEPAQGDERAGKREKRERR
jgi:hypothetical protein